MVVAEGDIIVVQAQQEAVVDAMEKAVAEDKEEAVAEEEEVVVEEQPVDASLQAAVETVGSEEEGEACAASLEQEEVVASNEPIPADDGACDDVEPVAESSSSLSPLRRAVESRRKSLSRLSLSAAMATAEATADATTTAADVEATSTASPVPAPAAVVVVVCRDTQRLFTKERPRADRRASHSSGRDSANTSHPLAPTTINTTMQKRKSIAAPHFRSAAREVIPSAPATAPAATEAGEGEEEDRAEEELGEGHAAVAMSESNEPLQQQQQLVEPCEYVEVDEEVVVTGSHVAAPSDLLEAASSDEMVTTITTIVTTITTTTIMT